MVPLMFTNTRGSGDTHRRPAGRVRECDKSPLINSERAGESVAPVACSFTLKESLPPVGTLSTKRLGACLALNFGLSFNIDLVQRLNNNLMG